MFLWGMTVRLILPMFFAGKTKVAEKLSMMFSWPQAITAVVGGILALLVLPAIRTYRKKHI
jgi:ABC-type transport system involved in cytochrome bd biosynthesis fused ATPase/permease subunit